LRLRSALIFLTPKGEALECWESRPPVGGALAQVPILEFTRDDATTQLWMESAAWVHEGSVWRHPLF